MYGARQGEENLWIVRGKLGDQAAGNAPSPGVERSNAAANTKGACRVAAGALNFDVPDLYEVAGMLLLPVLHLVLELLLELLHLFLQLLLLLLVHLKLLFELV